MTRSVLVDTFKALASQLIVLHHLCSYAPMTEWIAQAWPALVNVIAEDGRLAVQPFLVIGGFLAAQSLHRRRDFPVLDLVLQRYARLAPQLAMALLLVLGATVLVGGALGQAEWVSPVPGIPVLLAHLLLLQDVLGIPSVTAGAWYVAIDLQLFALFVVLLALAARLPRTARELVVPAALAAMTLASILVFSRQARLDMWAIYFFCAYGLGALAAWAGWSSKARWCWWAMVALVLVDWALEPRARPLWALGTALALHLGSQWSWSPRPGLLGRVVRQLSNWSYGLFVCHFAVILLVSGAWEMLHLSGLGAALAAFCLVVAMSLGLGAGVQAASDRLVLRWSPWGRMSPQR